MAHMRILQHSNAKHVFLLAVPARVFQIVPHAILAFIMILHSAFQHAQMEK